MESLEKKIKILQLEPVDTCVEAIVELHQLKMSGDKLPNFVYFKMYGKTRMFYSVIYILKTPLNELILKDGYNRRSLVKS